eukprot:771587-Prorocentrum_minimum.AAC.2
MPGPELGGAAGPVTGPEGSRPSGYGPGGFQTLQLRARRVPDPPVTGPEGPECRPGGFQTL